jgi:hydrogenase expression/formation protein HypC
MNAQLDDLMCLGVPGLVVDVADDGLVATVDFFGVRRLVRLELVDGPVAPGDCVLNHVGYAIRRIPEDDIAETLALYEQLLRSASDEDESDLMAGDVRSELAVTAGEGRED